MGRIHQPWDPAADPSPPGHPPPRSRDPDRLTAAQPSPPGQAGSPTGPTMTETRHDRQAPAHRGSRPPARLIPQIHRLQHTMIAGTAGALRGAERQHIRGLDLLWRFGDHREEHRLDAAARTVFGRHRPARNSRYTSASGTPATAASPERTPETARPEPPACTANSHRHRRLNPSRVSEMTRKITGITCRSGRHRPRRAAGSAHPQGISTTETLAAPNGGAARRSGLMARVRNVIAKSS